MPATTDRGVILHLAGHRRLSPALRDGDPAFAPPGEVVGRCGWAPFFAALEARGLAVAWDEADPAALRLVPRAEADPPPRRAGGALANARRFLRALLGEPPAAKPG